jgi:hypothetical protein
MAEPTTPDEDIPQDPGTSGLTSAERPPEGSLENPDGTDEHTGTEERRRTPRHRSEPTPREGRREPPRT